MAKRDDDLDLLKAIRLCSFGAVKAKDSDYVLRSIFRWYSREFHYPLPAVEDLPLEEVLTHFFECRYENMEEHDLDEEFDRLRETQVERLAREIVEKAAAEEDDEFFRETVAEAKATTAKLGKINLDERMDDPDLDRPILLPIMGERLPQSFQEIHAKLDPKLKSVPAEIKMEFVSDDELDGLDDWDVMGPPASKNE